MLGRAQNLGRRTGLDDYPCVHEYGLVGHLAREAHLVRDDDHRHPFLGERAHYIEHLADQLGIQRRGRLVEEHQLWSHRKRSRDRHPLLLATGQLRRVAPAHPRGVEPDESEQLLDAREPGRWEVVNAGHEIGMQGYSHENPISMTPEQEETVLDKCIALVTKLSGKRPRGYVAPWWEFSPVSNELLLKKGIKYDHSLMHHDFQPYYVRVGDKWTKIDYSQKPETWMKPMVRGHETDLIEIPGSWHLDDLPPMMFIKKSPNSHGFVNPHDIEQIWRDGEVVGERHFLDNRLGLQILRRLDRLAEREYPGAGRGPVLKQKTLDPNVPRGTGNFDWSFAVEALPPIHKDPFDRVQVAQANVEGAELVSADRGLGYLIMNSMRGLFTDRIFVGLFTIGGLGLAFDLLFKWLHRRLLPWSPTA